MAGYQNLSVAADQTKVLCVIPSVSLKEGGPSFAIASIVTALVGEGLAVDVATTHAAAEEQEKLRRDGVRYFSFPRQTNLYKTSLGFGFWLKSHVAEYDLIFINALFSFTSITAAWSARRRGIPYVIRPLGVLNGWGMRNRRRFLKRLSFRYIEAPLLRDASAIHYTSEQERREAQSLGVRTRSFVIPLGVDFEAFEERQTGDELYRRFPTLACREIILFLSRIDPKKGLEILLDSFVSIIKRRPQACLLIGGSGDAAYVGKLRAKVEHLGLAGNVVWAGFIEGAFKSAAFAEAKIFVLPSYSENFGIAAVEALTAGVPSVISKGVAVAAEIERAAAALVVEAKASELSTAILRLLEDERLAQRLASAGRAFAQNNYSIAKMGRSLVAMFRDVL